MVFALALGFAFLAGTATYHFARRLRARRGYDVYDEVADVRRFHEKFGFLVFDEPGHLTTNKALERFRFMREELMEFELAVAEQDLEKQADALIDLVYVAKGTALMLGIPWEAMWEEVQRANMDKVRGVTHRGNKSDARKPTGWIPPQHDVILAAAGYDRTRWFLPNDAFRFHELGARDDRLEPEQVRSAS